MIEKIGRFFIWVFLADAILSTLHELAGRGEGMGFLREIVAFTVVLWGIVLYFVMVFSPRPAKRVLLLPVLFAVWTGVFSAMPLSVLYAGVRDGVDVCTARVGCGHLRGLWADDGDGVECASGESATACVYVGNFAIGAAISAVFAVLMGSGAEWSAWRRWSSRGRMAMCA